MIKVYRGTDGDDAPVELECEIFGYPNKTTSGDTMFDNAHFRTENEAWEAIRKSVEVGVRLSGSDVNNAIRHLSKMEHKAAIDAARYARFHQNYRRRQQEGGVEQQCKACDFGSPFIEYDEPGRWHGTSMGPLLCKRVL